MCCARRVATSRSAATSACRSSTCRRRPTPAIHVVECSSFQIDLAPSLAPSVGLLINLTPDHLDRHGDDARTTPRSRSGWSRRSDVGAGRRRRRPIAARSAARLRRGGPRRVVAVSGAARRSPTCSSRIASRCVETRPKARSTSRGRAALRGAHNGQNAAFAFAAARALGVTRRRDRAGVRYLSRPRPSHGGGRPAWARAVRQRLEGDQRRRGREGAAVVPRHLLDSRRQGQGGRRSSRCGRFFLASPRPI